MTSAALIGDPARDEYDEPPGGDSNRDAVLVSVDYLGADEPIHGRFPQSALLGEVKAWAQGRLVPNPPADKAFYLVDDQREHRFSAEEERRTLRELQYLHKAQLRLVEEQLAGLR